MTRKTKTAKKVAPESPTGDWKGMLQFTDEEKIRQSVRYCMRHGGMGKRYIFSTSNCIFDGMPAESYRVMLREYRALREDRLTD